MKFPFLRKISKLGQLGQSMVAIVAAMGAAIGVTYSIMEMQKNANKAMQSTQEGVKFGNWTKLILDIIRGGEKKVEQNTYSCSAAFSHNLLLQGGYHSSTHSIKWPAYCSTGFVQRSADCGGTWNSTVFLQQGVDKEGMSIPTLRIKAGSSALVTYSATRKVYLATLELVAQKRSEIGGTNRLTWQQDFYATVDPTDTNNMVIYDCTLILPTPIPATPIPAPSPTTP